MNQDYKVNHSQRAAEYLRNSTTRHIFVTNKGELSEIKPPQMEWNDSDLPTAFKSFKQYCQLIFDGPMNAKEDKVKATYILLWIGEEGRKIFISFDLTADEKAKPDAIF